MSQGKILQIGSPREIYDHPAERFVASFIGETNFIEGKLKSVEKSQASVELPSGKTINTAIVAEQGGTRQKGDTVTIVIRPEHVRLGKPGAKSSLTGNVTNIVYIGTDTHYHLELQDGTPFIARVQNRPDIEEAYEVGHELGIEISSHAAQILKD